MKNLSYLPLEWSVTWIFHFSLLTFSLFWVHKKKQKFPPAFTTYLPWCSLDTVRDLRPFLRRAERTRRPLAVCIRRRKPCLLILFLLWGWKVLFIVLSYFFIVNHSFLPPQMPQHFRKATAKLVIFSKSAKEKTKKHKVFLSFWWISAFLTLLEVGFLRSTFHFSHFFPTFAPDFNK